MPRVVADLARCQGYANCMMIDPDRFDLDDDGRVRVLRADVSDAELARAREAVRSCPSQALRLEDRS